MPYTCNMALTMKPLKGYHNTTPGFEKPGSILQQEGLLVNILEDFDPASFLTIEKIATALSRLKRYSGNSKFSVAEHCCRGADAFLLMGYPDLAFIFLHHETGTEAVGFGDISGPIKRLLKKDDTLKQLETRTEEIVSRWLGIPYPWPPEIKAMDIALATDEMTMMKHHDINHRYWDECVAYDNFIAMHNKLKTYIDVYAKKELI